MSVVRVVGKGRLEALDAADLVRLGADAVRTLVDLGTGDGRFARATAREHPDWLVVGVDALAEPMEASARRAPRNLVFVRASVEALPADLRGIADLVTVLLPWGRLLEGIVRGDRAVVDGIAAVARPGAEVQLVLNGEIWDTSTPVRYADLPLPTPEYVESVVAAAFAAAGVDLGPARWMPADDAKALRTTWARKLGHGRTHPRYLAVAGTRR